MKPRHELRGDPRAIEQQIAAARQGVGPALGALLDAFRDYLLLIANAELDCDLRKKLGASDLVQETYLRAQIGFADFHGTCEAEFCVWLRQIMINHCRNVRIAYRETDKRNIDCEVPLEGTSSKLGPAGALMAGGASPSGQVMANEEAIAVARVVAGLPRDYQTVIRLRNWEGLTFEEIALRMERSSEAVRKLWSRAIHLLGDHWDTDNDA